MSVIDQETQKEINEIKQRKFELLAAVKSLSEYSLVAPYRLTGFAALSVERATTRRTLASIAA